MDLLGLRTAFDEELIEACNIAIDPERGFQVSIRRPRGLGWESYYGREISDAIERAVEGGPQLEDEPEEWGGLV